MRISLPCFLILFFSSQLFSQIIQKTNIIFEREWSEEGELTLHQLPGLTISISALRIIDDSVVACLDPVSQKIITYGMSDNQILKQYDVPADIIDFDFSEGFFYLISSTEITILSESGEVTETFPYRVPEKTLFSIEKIRHLEEMNMILTSDGKTYTVDRDGLHCMDTLFWHFPEGYSGRTRKLDLNSFLLSTKNKNSSLTEKIFFLETIGIPGALGTVSLIHLNDDGAFLDIETSTDLADDLPKRFLVQINNEGNVNFSTRIPFVYYSYLNNPFISYENDIAYCLLAPAGFYLYLLDSSNSTIQLPLDCPELYHYNFMEGLPDFTEPGPVIPVDTTNTESGSNCVNRTQVWDNAFQYVNLEWSASSSNRATSCTWLGSGSCAGYVKTPTWVTTGSKTSVPYKWGGIH